MVIMDINKNPAKRHNNLQDFLSELPILSGIISKKVTCKKVPAAIACKIALATYARGKSQLHLPKQIAECLYYLSSEALIIPDYNSQNLANSDNDRKHHC